MAMFSLGQLGTIVALPFLEVHNLHVKYRTAEKETEAFAPFTPP